MTNTFSQKQIQVLLTLATGTFGDGKGNTKIVDGLRTTVEIKKTGSPAKNEAVIRIYGMLPDDMTALSTLGFNPLAVRKNLVQVMAGDSDGLASVFLGEITGAWVAYHTPPDLYFEVHAMAAAYTSLVPSSPTSLAGAVPVASLFQRFASDMGLTFRNNGVTSSISNPYFTGSSMGKAQQLASAMNIEFGVDDDEMFICPLGTARKPKGSVPLLSPSTGLIGYPEWNKKGLLMRAIFNPAFQLNGQVIVQDSLIARANGAWRIHGLEHLISANDPKAQKWETKLSCVKEGV